MTDRIPVIFIYCALLFSLAACSGRPSGVLSKEDMAQLLADMHTGEAVIESSSRTFSTDSSRQAFLQAIYAKHGVTRQEVDSSLSWYGYNIERYMEVYDRTVEILESRLEKAQDIAGASAEGATEISVNLQGDSVDVWPGMRWRRFASNMPGNQITFSIENDRNWEKGDVYTLRTKLIDNHGPVSFTIAASYGDGTREYISKSLPGDGWHDLQFVADSARIPQRIYGVISYTPQKNENVFIDSISLMRTRWGGHYREARAAVSKFSNKTRSGASDNSRPVPNNPEPPLVMEKADLKEATVAPDRKSEPVPARRPGSLATGKSRIERERVKFSER